MPQIDFAQLFIQFLVLLFSLTVHEAAHATAANLLGDSTARLLGRASLNPAVHIDPVGTVLFPLIAMLTNIPVLGWAKPVPVNLRQLRQPRRDFMLVAAAGPASNLVLAGIASAVLGVWLSYGPAAIGDVDVRSPLASLLAFAVYLNVFLAVFNMVPIPPLDGGNVLGGLLPARLAAGYDRMIRPYGFIVLYGLMFTGALMALIGPPASVLLTWLL